MIGIINFRSPESKRILKHIKSPVKEYKPRCKIKNEGTQIRHDSRTICFLFIGTDLKGPEDLYSKVNCKKGTVGLKH